MRTCHVVVPAALAALLLAGCSGTSADPAEEVVDNSAETTETAEDGGAGKSEESPAGTGGEEEIITEWVFAANEQISVELTMHDTEDGGRTTPFYSGYRPTAEFDHLNQSVACSVQLPADLAHFEPGQTHLVGLECAEEVTVHVDEPGLVLIESGKESGEGEVIFPAV